MKQFLLPRWFAGQPRVVLSGDDFRYLVRVLRMREGDTLHSVDSKGAKYEMRFIAVGREECTVDIGPALPAGEPRPRDVRLTLLQCLPKGRKIDLIVRQATETGVARIVLLVSENAVARPGADDVRVQRLLRVAREALQQSGTPQLPEIEGPRPLASIIGEDWGLPLVFHEKPVKGGSLHGLLADGPREVSLLVGPEGGLSEAEFDLARRAGFHPVHFATGVLRVETAATYALGAVQTILQERDAWRPVRAE